MENHADREEIIEAFKLGNGSSARYSETLIEKTIYEAMKLKDGTELRISDSQLDLRGTFSRSYKDTFHELKTPLLLLPIREYWYSCRASGKNFRTILQSG